MNKKFLILLAAALLPALLCMGKETESRDTISVKEAFIDMPPQLVSLLSKETRMEMIDSLDNGIPFKAMNEFGGYSEIDTVAPGFLSVKISNASSLQLKTLRLKDGNEILMTVYTTGEKNKSRDSEICFYDAGFNQLDTKKYFTAPKLSDFFETKGYKTKMKEIEEILPFYTILLEANPENSDLTAKLTYSDRLTVEDAKIIELFIKPEITFTWNGKSFKQ